MARRQTDSRGESFSKRLALSSLRSRRILNGCWAGLAVAWLGWCLCWPFYARQQDMRAIDAEMRETYRVCLEQPELNATDCATDRAAYTKLYREQAAVPGENVYQSFAGKRLSDSLTFMTVLVLLPLLLVYAALRAGLELILLLGRMRGLMRDTV